MSVMEKLVVGNVVSFSTHAQPILGVNNDNLVVQAILDKESASVYSTDINSLHKNLYSYLPVGTPQDPTDYLFVKLKDTGGNVKVLGIPWIDEDTLTVVERGNLQITIPNVTFEDRENIIKAITAIGFKPTTVILE